MDARRRVEDSDLRLDRWRERDRPLLDLENTPAMTRHLGGLWTRTELDRRHRRFIDGGREGMVRAFRVSIGREPVGGVVYWRETPSVDAVSATTQVGTAETAETAEIGWVVYEPHQGRGIAGAAVRRAVATFRADPAFARVVHLHAYPHVDNAASNAVAASAGFELVGRFDEPYRGRPFVANDWMLAR